MLRIKTETAVGLFIIAAISTFLYMSYQIGSFRFDRIKYNTYLVYFQDVSGMSKKADVKISGVKVGWVDVLELVNEGQQVKATLMVNKKYVVHADAYAIVRQEGFLGTKHLELVPGNPLLPALPSGSMLTRPNRSPVTIDEMMHQFSEVAHDMQAVVKSLKNVIGGPENEQALRGVIHHLEDSMKHISSFAGKMDRVMADNETNISTILSDLKNAIPNLSDSIQRNLERIATDLDRGIAPIRDTMQKVNDGRGILGQLVNDEETSHELKVAINGVKTYFDKVEKLKIIFDIHTETMTSPMEGRGLTRESKSYANIRIHTTEDYFYMVGLIGTRNGVITRYDEARNWFNGECHQLIPDEMDITPGQELRFAQYRRFKLRQLDKMLFNVQLGKIFGNFAFRFGLFDSTGGVGMDIDLPLGLGDIRWVSTFEAFDFSGVNRYFEESTPYFRPHLKWLNRVFFTRNLYVTLGADDFISKCNASPFFGIGIRFADDDLKYMLSRVIISAPA